MIINYLRKLRSELLKEKLELETKMNAVQLKLSESTRFIQKLKEEEERSYDAFSPRRQNVELRDSISHLEEDQKVVLDSFEKVERELSDLNFRLNEIDAVLKYAVKQKGDLAKLVKEQEKDDDLNSMRDWDISFREKLESLLYKLEFCLKLVEIDPVRCKIELSSMVKGMNKIVEQLSEIGENENGEE